MCLKRMYICPLFSAILSSFYQTWLCSSVFHLDSDLFWLFLFSSIGHLFLFLCMSTEFWLDTWYWLLLALYEWFVVYTWNSDFYYSQHLTWLNSKLHTCPSAVSSWHFPQVCSFQLWFLFCFVLLVPHVSFVSVGLMVSQHFRPYFGTNPSYESSLLSSLV